VVFGAGNFGLSYAVPVFVQTVQGFTATKAGFVLVPAGIMLMFLFPFTGKLTDRVPNHLLIMFGLVTFAAGAILMWGADTNTPLASIIIFVMIGRFGQSLILPAMNASALRSMPPDKLNRASGGINFMRQFGGALGINTLVAFMAQRTVFHGEALTATQTAGNAASRELLGNVETLLQEAGVPEAVHQSGALHFLGQVVQAQADTLGFQDGFMVLATIFLLAMIPAWILGKARTTKV
jgi:MFS family permease